MAGNFEHYIHHKTNTVTNPGQFADTPTHGLDISQNGLLAICPVCESSSSKSELVEVIPNSVNRKRGYLREASYLLLCFV